MTRQITYIGETNHRNNRRAFGIKERDRFSHMHLVGKTGVGKSTLLKNMLLQDIKNGNGCALFDPHGDLVGDVLPEAEKWRSGDLTYLDATALRPSFHFNPLAGVPVDSRPLAAAGLIDVFMKVWRIENAPRFEHLLRNVVFTLLDVPDASLGLVPRLLTDRSFRQSLLHHVRSTEVRDFWTTEFDRYSPGMRGVVLAPLQNKIGALLTDPRLRRVLGTSKSTFRLSRIMDAGGVLLVNLSKGRMGEGPSSLLGSLLVSYLSQAALARAGQPEEDRRPFFVYLDEFQHFSTLALANMLAELRKYRVGMVLAHQYFSQLEPEIRDAVLGNVGTLISFRVGAPDAALLAREFEPVFERVDLLTLPNFHIYLKLMIDGQVGRGFSAVS